MSIDATSYFSTVQQHRRENGEICIYCDHPIAYVYPRNSPPGKAQACSSCNVLVFSRRAESHATIARCPWCQGLFRPIKVRMEEHTHSEPCPNCEVEVNIAVEVAAVRLISPPVLGERRV